MFKKSTLLLLIAEAYLSFSAQAQPASVRSNIRFEQVVAAVGGEGNKITEDQLIKFLRAEAKERLDLLSPEDRAKLLAGKTEDEFLDKFSEEQAARKVINNLPVASRTETHAIEAADLEAFESAKLDLPLPATMKDLLKNLLPSNVSMPVPPLSRAGETLLQRLDKVISIRQSFLDDSAVGKPATFTWTKFGRSDETLQAGRDRSKFDIRGAFTFEPTPFKALGGDGKDQWKFSYNPVFVYEVNSSSDDHDKRNSITHRVGFQSVLYHELRTGQKFVLTVDYKTDRDYKSDVWGFTFQWTPNAFDIGLGQWWPRRQSFAHYIWRPYIGVTAAEVRDPGDNADLQSQKDFTNAFARLTGTILLGSRVKITPEVDWVRELKGRDQDHTDYSIAAQWLFDLEGRLSLLLSYERGESAPTFKKKDVTMLSLGLKL